MLSQYSWWDYTKVVLVVLFVYYAYVLWTYYRQDIWEWFNNLGKKEQVSPEASVDQDEEEDASDLYSVKTYSTTTPVPIVSDEIDHSEPTVDEDEDEQAEQDNVNHQVDQSIKSGIATYSATQEAPVDVEISDGVIVADQPSETFELGLPATAVRPAERSLAAVINAARRVSADERGAFSSQNPDDAEALELAGTLNEQKGIGNLLDGVSFTR